MPSGFEYHFFCSNIQLQAYLPLCHVEGKVTKVSFSRQMACLVPPSITLHSICQQWCIHIQHVECISVTRRLEVGRLIRGFRILDVFSALTL